MGLTPTLESMEAVFRKLEREGYRVFHAKTRIARADHFYNFCITAHALRDFYFEREGLIQKEARRPFIESWRQVPILVAVEEIANSAKHFVLREPRGVREPRRPSTRRVSASISEVAEVYRDRQGNVSFASRDVPDLSVTLENGKRFSLWEFMDLAIDFWKAFMREKGIRIRRQSFARLSAG